MKRLLPLYHEQVLKYINKRDVCCDMTVGSGGDTLFLCGACKKVFGFDINAAAIAKTQKLIDENRYIHCHLICDNHFNFDEYVIEDVSCFMFHLGGYDNSSTSCMTDTNTLFATISKCLLNVKIGGIVAIMANTSNDVVAKVSEELEVFLSKLPLKRYEVLVFRYTNQKNAPYCAIIRRRGWN